MVHLIGHQHKNANNQLDLFKKLNNIKNMPNTITELENQSYDPRKNSLFNFRKKPWETGKFNFNKYGENLGIGNETEDDRGKNPSIREYGYQSPFTTLKKPDLKYYGDNLYSQDDIKNMTTPKSAKWRMEQPQSKSGYETGNGIKPFSSITNMYNKGKIM